jgi:hypothetical protein
MNAAKPPDQPPKRPATAAEAAEARRTRQAEALRANLRRRKAGGEGAVAPATGKPGSGPKPG